MVKGKNENDEMGKVCDYEKCDQTKCGTGLAFVTTPPSCLNTMWYYTSATTTTTTTITCTTTTTGTTDSSTTTNICYHHPTAQRQRHALASHLRQISALMQHKTAHKYAITRSPREQIVFGSSNCIHLSNAS